MRTAAAEIEVELAPAATATAHVEQVFKDVEGVAVVESMAAAAALLLLLHAFLADLVVHPPLVSVCRGRRWSGGSEAQQQQQQQAGHLLMRFSAAPGTAHEAAVQVRVH